MAESWRVVCQRKVLLGHMEAEQPGCSIQCIPNGPTSWVAMENNHEQKINLL